ncbi:MAG: glycoside hydrolase family 1 protein [Chthoniobacterales bacterium]|nr:glycoside hydrolase family 1 protein [Chthoniobacterales bacterium]
MIVPGPSGTDNPPRLSPDFLVGVATAGYQCEGGYNGTGQPHNNWANHEACGRVAVTGVATDFWNRYREDYALCRDIGLNAFRLSIEWTRVQPSDSAEAVTTPPDFDQAAIDAYAERIAACRLAGMEPVVTLHHFTHPAWLGCDAWLEDTTPALFEKFVVTTLARLNDQLCERFAQAPIHWYVTLNEPNMLVLNTYLNRHFPGGSEGGIQVGLRAYNRLLAAHVRAYNAIHDLHESRGWPSPRVTMNTFCSDVYWSEQMLLDLLCFREHRISPSALREHLGGRANALADALRDAHLPVRADPLTWAGQALQVTANFLVRRAATVEAFDYFLAEAGRSKRDVFLDYLGLDYYDPFLIHIFRIPSFRDLEFPQRSLHGRLMDGLSSKWWDWHILPEGLHAFCAHYARSFPGKGILIAENGMALRLTAGNQPGPQRRDRITRSEFLCAHFDEMRRMLDAQIPLLGYLHWSLTDNYEWGSFSPRFGLFQIDYAAGLQRRAVDHLGDNPSLTYARLIRKLRQSGGS